MRNVIDFNPDEACLLACDIIDVADSVSGRRQISNGSDRAFDREYVADAGDGIIDICFCGIIAIG